MYNTCASYLHAKSIPCNGFKAVDDNRVMGLRTRLESIYDLETGGVVGIQFLG